MSTVARIAVMRRTFSEAITPATAMKTDDMATDWRAEGVAGDQSRRSAAHQVIVIAVARHARLVRRPALLGVRFCAKSQRLTLVA